MIPALLISGVMCVILTLFLILEKYDKDKGVLAAKARNWLALIFTISSLIGLLTPSSQTVAMMVVIPKIADSKVIQEDIPSLYEAALEALKEQIKKK